MRDTIKSILGMFKVLKSDGTITRSCDRNKATACKTILERATLIECVSSSYMVGRYGKAYGVGRAHPGYAEMQATIAIAAMTDTPTPSMIDDDYEPLTDSELAEQAAMEAIDAYV